MSPFYDIYAKLRYIKFCLLLFTFLLVLTGIGLIIIGSTINTIYYEFMSFLEINYFTPATFLVGIGFLIFIVASIGLYGTWKQSSKFIAAFGSCLGIICVLQLAVGLTCHFMTESLAERLRFTLNETMYEYHYSSVAAEKVDTIQSTLHCCGFSGVKTWNEIFNSTVIPVSCCEMDDNDQCEYINNMGCFWILESILRDSSKILTTSSAVLALMQLTGMLFAFYMAQCLIQQVRSRQQRKLLVTEQLLYSDFIGSKPTFNLH